MAKNYYEILGVPRNASELEIKSAYHRLARKYHPDKATDPTSVAALEAEFSQISTAYNVLKDREKRSAYDSAAEANRAKSGESSGKFQAATGPSVGGSGTAATSSENPMFGGQVSEKSRQLVAKRAFAKGMQLMAAGDHGRAAEFFENAIRNNDEEAIYHARLALACLRSHRSFTRATEACQRAIDLDPYNSDFRLILAELYENANSKTMAVKTYEEILKWDPNNEKAKMALQQLNPRRGGLFGKLFGKKS